jgi:preprotein translocase subunit SecB
MDFKLSFDDYHVIETVYKRVPNNDFQESISPQFNVRIKYADKNYSKASILLTIELGDKALKQNSVYVKAKIMGIFSLEVNTQEVEEDINSFYKINALAILYPYIRSLVSDLTGKGNEAPLILPPMNIIQMVEDKELVEEKVDPQITKV